MASSKVFKITEGVLSRITDLTLFVIFYQFELGLGNAKTRGGVQRAAERTSTLLEEVNYKSIKRALLELRRRGLIKVVKSSLLEPEITALGKRRIKEIIPQYHRRRPWDGNIYLVIYDIPVIQNNERNTLRMFLQKMGCGLLQESIWITPYNPTQIIREFADSRGLGGTILVSVLGKEGSIGGMSLEQLIESVYHLAELNEEYGEFLSLCQQGVSKEEVIFKYLSVLDGDPQLPFELLPEDWLGNEAFKRLMSLLRTK